MKKCVCICLVLLARNILEFYEGELYGSGWCRAWNPCKASDRAARGREVGRALVRQETSTHGCHWRGWWGWSSSSWSIGCLLLLQPCFFFLHPWYNFFQASGLVPLTRARAPLTFAAEQSSSASLICSLLHEMQCIFVVFGIGSI